VIWLCAASLAYLAIAAIAVRRFTRRPLPPPNDERGITIVKPVHGLEPELEENLRSFCAQQHPRCQVLFGVQRPDDPAIAIVERVIAAHPERDCALIVDPQRRAPNPKMSNVAAMLPHARYDLLAISDADMRVDPAYAGTIAAAFDDTRTGAATALYRGEPRGGRASTLAAMHADWYFAPSVLVATLFGPPRFCFGSTMAVRRDVLTAIGGIEALGAHLADDYTLGRLVSEAGYRVALSRYVVTNVMHETSVGTLFSHEVRWARTIRMVQPLGYVFSVLTYPLVFIALAFAFARDGAALVAAGAALAAWYGVRYAICVESGSPLPRDPLSLLLREGLEIAVWAAGLTGRRVRWQEQTLQADERGLL
jgi:ceramide glucosyltransferase